MSRSNQLPNLDKIFKDEDEQDFTPLGGSNLAAIFGTPQKLGDVSSTSKQLSQTKSSSGRNTPQTVQTATKTEVIIAKAVHAYKLDNGQYSLIGKLGLALTGNTSTKIYQIILYRNKQDHISVVTLTPTFAYTIRENNYATYYDANNENWSLLFENEEACIDFAREIGVSRFLARQTRLDDSVMYQNLTLNNEEGGAREGDEIVVKTVICANLGQPVKINVLPGQTMNIQISQDDNWERSLMNAGKGLKRLMILPPSKQISLGPSFPREKEIILEVEIIDIVKPEEKQPVAVKPAISSGKAAILSRMAKMGQSMLPKVPTSTTTDSEDTEDEIHVKSPRRFKSETASSHANKHQSRLPQDSSEEAAASASFSAPRNVPSGLPIAHRPSIMSNSAFATPWTPGPIQQQYITMDGQYYPVHQAAITQPITAAIDPNMNVFLSETRTQNSEIRMGISKIADNVQKLLDKFHVLEVQSASSPINDRAMENSLKMLMALNANNTRIDQSANIRYPTNPEIASTQEDSARILIAKLENELKSAKETSNDCTKKIGSLKAEKQEWSMEKADLNRRIEHLEKSLNEAQVGLQKSLNDLKSADGLAAGYLKDKAILEATIFKLNAEKDILEKSAATSGKKELHTGNDKTTEIKQIMNKTYQTLLAKFTEDSYTTEYIKQTVANTIRNITLQVLKEDKVEENPTSDEKIEVKNFEVTGVPPDSSTAEASDKNSITLPEISDSSSNPMSHIIPPVHEEPPPIPPMDMDADADWLP